MKRIMKACLLLIATITIAAMTYNQAAAAEQTEINLDDATAIPDEAFREYLKEKVYDTDEDGKLSPDEINKITGIHIYNCNNISDFTGIEKLNALKFFEINSASKITSLDLSGNNGMLSVDIIGAEKLTSIVLGDMDKLTSLTLTGTSVTKLDVSGCPNLEELYADENELIEVNLSNNTKLQSLKVSHNQLTAVETAPSANNLVTFYCYNNKITKLDLTENTKLNRFIASDNRLPALDLSKQENVTVKNEWGESINAVDKQVYYATAEKTSDSKYLLRIKNDSNSIFEADKVIEESITNGEATLTEDGFVFDKEDDIPLKFSYRYETNLNGNSYPMTVTVINREAKASVRVLYRNLSIFNWNNPNPWEYTMGSDPITLQPVEKEGAVFSKWVLWNYSGDPKYLPAVTELSDDLIMEALLSGDDDYVTLRAVFEPDVVEIAYDRICKEDGSLEPIDDPSFKSNNPSHLAFGETIVLKDASRDGYTFEGWYTDPYYAEESRVTEFCENDEIYFTDRFLYAKWSKKATSGDTTQQNPNKNDSANNGSATNNSQQGTSANAVGNNTSIGANSQLANFDDSLVAKGKRFTVADKKCIVMVTSSDKANPTVIYIKSTEKNIKKVVIPDSVIINGITYKVIGIADNAFKNCKKLSTVTIGNNIKSIGKNAFKGINKKAKFKLKCTKKTKAALKKKLKNKKVGYVKGWIIK